MVSRLLSSLSGILSSCQNNSSIEKDSGKEDIKNENEHEQSTMDAQQQLETSHNSKKADFSMQMMDAESLDRVIVNKLQSKMSTSVADALGTTQTASRVKSRCEVEVPKSTVPSNCGNNVEENPMSDKTTDLTAAENVHGVPISVRSATARFHKHSSASQANQLSKSSVMSQEIPAFRAKTTHTFKDLMEDLEVTEQTPEYDGTEELNPGERRSVMYRNSQFNLENASKEALCSRSSSTKHVPDGTLHSEALLHLPMFGIPDPSLHCRRPSLTSSTESVQGSESRILTTTTYTDTTSTKKRTRSMSPTGRMYTTPRLSGTKLGDHLFESTINDIIDKGGDEFRVKYSSWIWDAFRTQLVKVKSIMVTEFNEKMKAALDERERDVIDLQKRYRQKLGEFDVTTQNFQKLLDNMYKENQRMLTAKDFVIDKLKKEFLECKKHFEKDLQRQMDGYRKEAEVERMELQKRNDELMLIMLTDASKCGLEEVFKTEIESLRKMIKTLTAQNEKLNQQLDEATSSSAMISRAALENLETQLDRAVVDLMEIRKKLQYTESEKEDLRVTYQQEIAKLNRKIQESSTRYDHQLRDAAEELEALRKKHTKDTKELKHKLATQEAQHNATLYQVRQQYGSQVEALSQAVSQLRAELTGNGTSRFSHFTN